jgi:GDP-4-dehydro-6-deoxy-D-mannose reductase
MVEPDYRSLNFSKLDYRFLNVNLRDKDRLCKVIYDFAPDYILHLASYSSVTGSWKSPGVSFQNNVNTFLNLVESIRSIGLKCRLISVGTSEEYGSVNVKDLPLSEDHMLNPSSPFAIARLSQELVAKLYEEVYGLDIIMTRSFNHIGQGMNPGHAVASFARQLVEIRDSRANELLITGDTRIVRDFVDVRDVVRAYDMLFQNGKKGQIYNVCSGCGISLANIIKMMCESLKIEITIKENRQLLRPKDNPVIIGSNAKIRSEIGWSAEYSIEESIKEVLEYFAEMKANHFGKFPGVTRKFHLRSGSNE